MTLVALILQTQSRLWFSLSAKYLYHNRNPTSFSPQPPNRGAFNREIIPTMPAVSSLPPIGGTEGGILKTYVFYGAPRGVCKINNKYLIV